jgi:16S rRNA (guanine527-N7)-methyltransferase
MNLISCHSARELVNRHLLDSLAVAQALPEDPALIVDLGSGAGLPGLPLAILRPDLRFALVEVRRRRCSFLREVRRNLDLANVEVLEQRAEHPPAKYVHAAAAAVSRAVWTDHSLIEIAGSWLSQDGTLLWMRSDPLPSNVSSKSFRVENSLRYQIEGERSRCVVVLRREAACWV